MEAAKRKNREEMTQKEEEKNEKMDELVDWTVVDAAKARVLEALRKGEEQDEMGKDVEGKEDALIGLN